MFYKNSLIARYISAGILNTIFGYALYAILMVLGLHSALSLAIATICGVAFNYKTSGLMVFHGPSNGKLIKFLIGYLFVYCVNVICISVLFNFGMSEYLSGAVMQLPAAVMTFLIQKKWVFKND